MKKLIWLFALVLVFALSGLIMADDSHKVTVTVNSFARVSVVGTASVELNENDFVNGVANKDLTSTVQITVKTNKSAGCKVYASAPDFTIGTASGADSFGIGLLQAKVNATGASFVPLSITSTQLVSLNTKQSNVTYDVLFKLVALPETVSAGDYSTVVTYTAAANS